MSGQADGPAGSSRLFSRVRKSGGRHSEKKSEAESEPELKECQYHCPCALPTGGGQPEAESPQAAGLRGEALRREGQPHGTDCCQGAGRHSDTQAGQQSPTPETPANWEQGNGAEDRGGGSEGAPPFRSHQPRPPARAGHGTSICENQQLDEQRNSVRVPLGGGQDTEGPGLQPRLQGFPSQMPWCWGFHSCLNPPGLAEIPTDGKAENLPGPEGAKPAQARCTPPISVEGFQTNTRSRDSILSPSTRDANANVQNKPRAGAAFRS